MEIRLTQKTNQIIQKIHENSGHCYLVGGYIRDTLLGLVPYDIDIEVYNISFDNLIEILKEYDEILIFEKFGTIKLKYSEVSFSIPRTEIKTGVGYTNFRTCLIPDLTLEEAVKRRDFTINAIMYDLKSNEIIDLVGGVEDLKLRKLIHITNSFDEDPVRILRALRFSTKYNLKIDDNTYQMMKKMVGELKYVSNHKINEEIMEIANANYLSENCEYFYVIFTELFALQDLDKYLQPLKYHPEGNVKNHIIQTIKVASFYKKELSLSRNDNFILIITMLFHDLGKKESAILKNKIEYSFPKHAEYSKQLFDEYKNLLVNKKTNQKMISNLIEDHMKFRSIKKLSNDEIYELYKRYKKDLHLFWLVNISDLNGRMKEFDEKKLYDKEYYYESQYFNWKLLFNKIAEAFENYSGQYFINLGTDPKDIKKLQKEKIHEEISEIKGQIC